MKTTDDQPQLEQTERRKSTSKERKLSLFFDSVRTNDREANAQLPTLYGRRRAREREVRGQGEVDSRGKLKHSWKLEKQNTPVSEVRAGSRTLRR